MRILPMEVELFHADGRADRHEEVDTRFSQFFESAQKLQTFTGNLLLRPI